MIMELYVSGILTAELDPFALNDGVRCVDLSIGRLGELRAPTTELLEQLIILSGIDFSELEAKLLALQPMVSENAERILLPDGTDYEKKDAHHYVHRHSAAAMDLLVDDGSIVGVIRPERDSVTILVAPRYRHLTVLSKWDKLYPEPIHGIKELGTVMIPMRDGVRLATTVWLPTDMEDPLPCILIRTPYGKILGLQMAKRFVHRGYAIAMQDVRGRHDSEGAFEPLTAETEDGSDTIDYIAEQSWCNGSIGMIGASYLGYVQWAAAASRNPHLKVLVSEVCAGSAFADLPKRGGTMESGVLAWTFLVGNRITDVSRMDRDDWDEILSRRPLNDVVKDSFGEDIPFWRHWVEHETNDEYWKPGDWYQRAIDNGGLDLPCLIQTGWFDDDGMGSTQALDITRDYPKGQRKVIIGPWKHEGNAAYDLHGVALGDMALRYDLDLNYYAWFEKHLRGRKVDAVDSAPVEYFTLWENVWKKAEKWPPENTVEEQLWLNGEKLSARCPEKEKTRSFVYDPDNPAVNLIDVSENELEVPEDYTEEEKRSDYVCFTTEPFTEDTVFTGDGEVTLYLSSDAEDTDLYVRLTKVLPDGRSIKFADAILDMKFREGFDRQVFMKPGEVYPVSLRTMKFSTMIRRGECLRLSITSSGVNMSFPNSNTREGFNSAVTRKATNTIHCGGKYPSRITIRREV